MSEEKTTTSTNCGDYTITFYNIDGFMNGSPVIRMYKGLRVPFWFYSITRILFGRMYVSSAYAVKKATRIEL